jgi:hypothetical protein
MFGLRITISGPGQTFDVEIEYIKRVLEEMGWEVSVKDEFRKSLSDVEFEHGISLRKDINVNSTIEHHAEIIADHCCWGG